MNLVENELAKGQKEYSPNSIKMGSYELKLASPNFSDSESIDFISFMHKVYPSIGYFTNKALELGKSEISKESHFSKEELGDYLTNKVYPRMMQLEDIESTERLLNELYIAYPSSKAIIEDIKSQFNPNNNGVVYAIPPVIIAGVVVYALGYAFGYYNG